MNEVRDENIVSPKKVPQNMARPETNQQCALKTRACYVSPVASFEH